MENNEKMEFPNTFEEFAKTYSIVDKEEIWSNGIEFIPVFRVKQWLEHIEKQTVKKVNICGIPHKVIYCKDSFDIDTHLGMICYKENEIRINEDMSENQKKETLCHEMVHGMLIHLGFDDLSNNEQFVQSLGNAIYNSFEIKELNNDHT